MSLWFLLNKLNMQNYVVFVVLLATSSLESRSESTTSINDVDNSVYSENETPSPLPQIPENIKPTRCFTHLPEDHQIDTINTNNIDIVSALPASDPIPPNFETFTPTFNGGSNFRPVYESNYYRFNQPPPPPMPFSSFQRFPFSNQPSPAQPLVIVKLLQPIILPVAKAIFPATRKNSGEIDDEKSTETELGFSSGPVFNRFHGRRFASEKYRSFVRPLPYRQQNFGNEDNIQITVKLN